MAIPGRNLNPNELDKILDHLAEGHTIGHTAEVCGVCESTVKRTKSRFSEELQRRTIAHLTKTGPMCDEIECNTLSIAQKLTSEAAAKPTQEGAKMLQENIGVIQVADKIIYRHGQAVGMFASHAPSTVIQNVINIQSQMVVSPQVAALFAPDALAQLTDGSDDPIDCDWSELGGPGDE